MISQKKTIKLLLVDDQKMFLDGISAFLESDESFEIIGTALNGEMAIESIDKYEPDVVVLDIEMPVMNGIEAAEIILKKHSNVKILILTMYNRKDFIMKLMGIGVHGYLLKNKSKEELMAAIHNVYRGQAHFSLEVLQKAVNPGTMLDKEVKLTDREVEILSSLGDGLTTREIAAKLFISEPTVNTHRRNLLRKLEFSSDKHLIRYSIKKGFSKL